MPRNKLQYSHICWVGSCLKQGCFTGIGNCPCSIEYILNLIFRIYLNNWTALSALIMLIICFYCGLNLTFTFPAKLKRKLDLTSIGKGYGKNVGSLSESSPSERKVGVPTIQTYSNLSLNWIYYYRKCSSWSWEHLLSLCFRLWFRKCMNCTFLSWLQSWWAGERIWEEECDK